MKPVIAQKRLEALKALAISNGGLCLSETYLGCTVPLRWRCQEGHEWEASPTHLKASNAWCPTCSRIAKGYSIEVPKAYAEARGGRCLSTRMNSHNQGLIWRCQQGHVWVASFHRQRNSVSWCPFCSKGGRGHIKDDWSYPVA